MLSQLIIALKITAICGFRYYRFRRYHEQVIHAL